MATHEVTPEGITSVETWLLLDEDWMPLGMSTKEISADYRTQLSQQGRMLLSACAHVLHKDLKSSVTYTASEEERCILLVTRKTV